jgi:tetratricopeptide (TPR) repeat protein
MRTTSRIFVRGALMILAANLGLCVHAQVSNLNVGVATDSGRQAPAATCQNEQQKPSLPDRARALLARNPVTWGWSKWRGRKQKANTAKQVVTSHYDRIALANPTGPPSVDLLVAAAEVSEKSGAIEQSRRQYQDALATHPNHAGALLASAHMEDRQGNLRVAEQLYRRLVDVNSKDPTAFNDLGLCLARQGRLDESAEAIHLAVALQPGKQRYRNNLANVFVEMHRDQEALQQLTAVHGPAIAHFNLGHLLASRGRIQDAAAHLATVSRTDARVTQVQLPEATLAAAQPGHGPPPTILRGAAVGNGGNLMDRQTTINGSSGPVAQSVSPMDSTPWQQRRVADLRLLPPVNPGPGYRTPQYR